MILDGDFILSTFHVDNYFQKVKMLDKVFKKNMNFVNR